MPASGTDDSRIDVCRLALVVSCPKVQLEKLVLKGVNRVVSDGKAEDSRATWRVGEEMAIGGSIILLCTRLTGKWDQLD